MILLLLIAVTNVWRWPTVKAFHLPVQDVHRYMGTGSACTSLSLSRPGCANGPMTHMPSQKSQNTIFSFTSFSSSSHRYMYLYRDRYRATTMSSTRMQRHHHVLEEVGLHIAKATGRPFRVKSYDCNVIESSDGEKYFMKSGGLSQCSAFNSEFEGLRDMVSHSNNILCHINGRA